MVSLGGRGAAGEKVYYLGHKLGRAGKHSRWEECVEERTGWYQARPGDHIQFRYEVMFAKPIGEGSNARVFKAYDHKHCRLVAIKVARPEHAEHARCEIECLNFIHRDKPLGAEHIVALEGSFLFRGVYFLVFPLATATMYHEVMNSPYEKLSVQHVQSIARQLMKALQCLEAKGYVHGDIKADNVMVMPPSQHMSDGSDSESGKVVLIDLGSALFLPVSRALRYLSPLGAISCKAPEALLELEWGSAIDTWSVGLLLFFMVTGENLVNPRVSDRFDALQQQVTVLGCPTEPVVARWKEEWDLRSKFARSEEARSFPISILTTRTQGRDQSLHCKLEQTVLGDGASVQLFGQFLSACMDWDPAARMTPNDALQHAFLQGSVAIGMIIAMNVCRVSNLFT